jgi:hypothetical protein
MRALDISKASIQARLSLYCTLHACVEHMDCLRETMRLHRALSELAGQGDSRLQAASNDVQLKEIFLHGCSQQLHAQSLSDISGREVTRLRKAGDALVAVSQETVMRYNAIFAVDTNHVLSTSNVVQHSSKLGERRGLLVHGELRLWLLRHCDRWCASLAGGMQFVQDIQDMRSLREAAATIVARLLPLGIALGTRVTAVIQSAAQAQLQLQLATAASECHSAIARAHSSRHLTSLLSSQSQGALSQQPGTTAVHRVPCVRSFVQRCTLALKDWNNLLLDADIQQFRAGIVGHVDNLLRYITQAGERDSEQPDSHKLIHVALRDALVEGKSSLLRLF